MNQQITSAYVDFSTLPPGMTHQEARELIKRAAELAGYELSGNGFCELGDYINFGFDNTDNTVRHGYSQRHGQPLPIYTFLAWLQDQKKPKELSAVEKLSEFSYRSNSGEDSFRVLRSAILEVAKALEKETP